MTAQAVLTATLALFVAVVTIRQVLELAAHVGRYRRYRRTYPAANRSRVWRHVR